MKLLILWFASLLPLLATPDWANKTNETYLGSNEKFYATFLTETDNQGSYYEWHEVKKLNSKGKKAKINTISPDRPGNYVVVIYQNAEGEFRALSFYDPKYVIAQ